MINKRIGDFLKQIEKVLKIYFILRKNLVIAVYIKFEAKQRETIGFVLKISEKRQCLGDFVLDIIIMIFLIIYLMVYKLVYIPMKQRAQTINLYQSRLLLNARVLNSNFRMRSISTKGRIHFFYRNIYCCCK